MCCYCLGCCGKEQTEPDASGQQTIGTPAQQQIQMQPIQMQQIQMQPLNQPPPQPWNQPPPPPAY